MPIKDYKELSEKEKKKILSEITKNANADQRKVMPIKKECTICKVRHPEHPKLINVKEFEGKYTQSIEEQEWEIEFDKEFGSKEDWMKGLTPFMRRSQIDFYEELKEFLKSTLEQVVKETKEDMRIELAKKVIDLKDEEESKLFYKLLKYLGIEVVAKTNKKK